MIITDPFIFTDRGEAGSDGGFGNLLLYLDALGFTKESSFKLRITGGPKKPTANQVRWAKTVTMSYPKIKIERFTSKLVFHDRLYIVKHAGGHVRGVFGPSLNGLGANDITLMGEIEIPGALETLSKWFGEKPITRAIRPRGGK